MYVCMHTRVYRNNRTAIDRTRMLLMEALCVYVGKYIHMWTDIGSVIDYRRIGKGKMLLSSRQMTNVKWKQIHLKAIAHCECSGSTDIT